MLFKKLTWYNKIGTRISILTCILVVVFIGILTYLSMRNQREIGWWRR